MLAEGWGNEQRRQEADAQEAVVVCQELSDVSGEGSALLVLAEIRHAREDAREALKTAS
jgi:hypothetical protein